MVRSDRRRGDVGRLPAAACRTCRSERLLAAPNDPSGNTVYAATWLGVYRTTDGGASWSQFGAGLPTVRGQRPVHAGATAVSARIDLRPRRVGYLDPLSDLARRQQAVSCISVAASISLREYSSGK